MGHAEEGYKLGKWIRRFRQRVAMTQREVARKADVTPAFLSQLENDKRAASAATLQRILAAMHVHSLGDFFYAVERGENPVHGEEDMVDMVGPDEPIRMEYLGPRTRNFSFCIIWGEMQPGYEAESEDVDSYDQCIYVLEGKLGVAIDGEEHEVNPFQACFIDAHRSHRARNLAECVTRFVYIHSTFPRDMLSTAPGVSPLREQQMAWAGVPRPPYTRSGNK